MKYWSSRSRSRGPTLRCRSLAWPATASRMLWPNSRRRTWLSISSWRALKEHAAENIGGLFFARDEHAGAGPGQAAFACCDVDAQVERGETGEMADAFGDELVERDGIAKTAAARVRRGSEEADVGGMAAIDVGMRDAAEHGESRRGVL